MRTVFRRRFSAPFHHWQEVKNRSVLEAREEIVSGSVLGWSFFSEEAEIGGCKSGSALSVSDGMAGLNHMGRIQKLRRPFGSGDEDLVERSCFPGE